MSSKENSKEISRKSPEAEEKKGKEQKEEKDEFLDQGFDLRRFLLLSVKHLWTVIFSVLLFAILFGVFRFMKEKVYAPEQLYRNDTLYYIEFTKGEEEETQAYFNDYTWNEILDSDAVAGVAVMFLGNLEKADIAAATTIPTMSDIRMFHVYVEDTDPAKADDMQNALELALGSFASHIDGMESITVMDRGKAVAVSESSTILRWIIAGALIGLLFGCLLLAVVYVLDDGVCLAADVRRSGGRCLGVIFREKGSKASEREEAWLKERLAVEFAGTEELRILDPAGTAVSAEAAARVRELLPEGIRLNTGDPAAKKLVCVAAGSIGAAQLKRFLEAENAPVVLCGVKESLHRGYYFHTKEQKRYAASMALAKESE